MVTIRIHVQELTEMLDRELSHLKLIQEQLEISKVATIKFVATTVDSFKGEAGDSTRAFLNEAYQPLQEKVLLISLRFKELLTDFNTDAAEKFGLHGILNEEYLQQEYLPNFSRFTHEEIENVKEINQIINEINEFFSFQNLNIYEIEEANYNMKQEVTKIIIQLHDFNTKWMNNFKEIQQMQDELDVMLDELDESKVSPMSYKTGMINYSSEEAEFLLTMKNQFGFSEEEAAIMYKVYLVLKSQTDNEVEAFKLFFAYMGGVCYGDQDMLGIEAWGIVSGTLNEADLKVKLIELGLSEDEYNLLNKAIVNQHNICAWSSVEEYTKAILQKDFNSMSEEEQSRCEFLFEQFKGSTDFAHMSVTLAAQLHSDTFKWTGSVYSGLENGIYSVEDNAGYAGDIFGVFGALPSMGKDDYRADLDAINLAKAMSENSSGGINVFNDYYNKIEAGELNRANEFVKNIGDGSTEKGFKVIQEQITNHLVNYSQRGIIFDYFGGGMKQIEDHIEVSLKFIKNLKEGNNEWNEDE
ncbi:hypothetical protein GJB75_05080 [Listeria monocytogenes]|nr:hypothetical protein [Listeria monocytogenes]